MPSVVVLKLHTNRPTVKSNHCGNAQWTRNKQTLTFFWSHCPFLVILYSWTFMHRDRQTDRPWLSSSIYTPPVEPYSSLHLHPESKLSPLSFPRTGLFLPTFCKCLKRPGAYHYTPTHTYTCKHTHTHTHTLVCAPLGKQDLEKKTLKWLWRSTHLGCVVCLLVGLLDLFVFTSRESWANLPWISM